MLFAMAELVAIIFVILLFMSSSDPKSSGAFGGTSFASLARLPNFGFMLSLRIWFISCIAFVSMAAKSMDIPAISDES